MPSLYTVNKSFEKQATGENENTWGELLNATIDSVDTSFGMNAMSVAGAVNIALSTAEARAAIQVYSGVLTGNINVFCPATPAFYFVTNNTTGAFSLTFKTSAGTGVVIPQNDHMIVYCDGANVAAAVLEQTPPGTIRGRSVSAGIGPEQNLTQAGVVNVLNQATVGLTYPLTVNVTTTGAALSLTSTEPGTVEGPSISVDRASATPAAADSLGVVRFTGRNSAAAVQEYAGIYTSIGDPVAGVETGTISFYARRPGTTYASMTLSNGLTIGAPTGGPMGNGTINAGAYYVNGAAVPSGAAGSVTNAMLADGSVTNTKLANMPAVTIKGAVSAGAPVDLTAIQAANVLATGTGGQSWNHRPVWQSATTANNPMGSTLGGLGEQEITGNGTGAAMMAFHRPGQFAAYLGLDIDSQFKVGGWSFGNNAYVLLHTGNIATKAQMEAQSGAMAMTPTYARYHPGIAKMYMAMDSATGVYAGYGYSSVADNGAGIATIYLSESVAQTYYPVSVTAYTSAFVPTARVQGESANAIQVVVCNPSGSTQDPTLYLVTSWGTSP